MSAISGLLNVRKPAGMTSRDVVNRVLACLPGRKNKVGHAGTLDPLAEGVLVICVGKATRLMEYVQQQSKAYTAVFELGKQSDTEDADGEIELLVDPPIPTHEQLLTAAAKWVGECLQRPPAYSALKVDGKRAHRLARAGAEVELAPRPIEVHSLQVAEYEYPFFKLHVECGKGTYVRSLGRDIAESLGSAVIMTNLVRTRIGDFQLDDCVAFETLNRDSLSEHMLPLLSAVNHLPVLPLHDDQRDWIWSGGFLRQTPHEQDTLVAAVDNDGTLISVLKQHETDLRPVRNMKY
ncbi:MAG: tRNA pseudouridine(55) synthase TruB [bacterium]|nr:tRNA pseudouridine(55) synthase TruB [bacterium]